MQIRRPLAGLFVALALFGGGAVLSGCESPGNTGSPSDDVSTTPTQSADNNLPDNSNRQTNSSDTGNDVSNDDG